MKRNKYFLWISPGFYFYLCLLVLTFPLKWVLSLGACIAIHELFHILAAKLLHIRIYSMEVRPGGFLLNTEQMQDKAELICALAGPLGGALPVLLWRIFPEMALISVFLTAYNMLPLYPADGGRALRCVLCMLLPRKTAYKIFEYTELTVLCTAVAAGLYMAVAFPRGYWLVILCFFPVLRAKIEKHLANSSRKRYNIPITDKEVPL